MKHEDGVHVSTCQADGAVFLEHHNPRGKENEAFRGTFSSGLIAVNAGEEIRIRIKIEEHFDWRGADGLLVTIVTRDGFKYDADAGQYRHLWFDSKCKTLSKEYISKECRSTVIQQAKAPFLAPRNVMLGFFWKTRTEWMIEEPYVPNQGCIVICARRAKLAKYNPEHHDGVPEPVGIFRKRYVVEPGAIERAWVDSLKNNAGLPYMFEYQTVRRQSLHVKSDRTNGHDGKESAKGIPMSDSRTRLSQSKICETQATTTTKVLQYSFSSPKSTIRATKKLRTKKTHCDGACADVDPQEDPDDDELRHKNVMVKMEDQLSNPSSAFLSADQQQVPAAVVETAVPNLESMANSSETDVDDALDVEDLELQLKEVQLLRKIHAAKKKQATKTCP